MATTKPRAQRRGAKTARIVTRVAPEVKEKIAYAASLTDTSLTAFVERTAMQAAEEIIQRHAVIPLSARASQALIESFFDPREPNAALERARQRHATLIARSEP